MYTHTHMHSVHIVYDAYSGGRLLIAEWYFRSSERECSEHTRKSITYTEHNICDP